MALELHQLENEDTLGRGERSRVVCSAKKVVGVGAVEDDWM